MLIQRCFIRQSGILVVRRDAVNCVRPADEVKYFITKIDLPDPSKVLLFKESLLENSNRRIKTRYALIAAN